MKAVLFRTSSCSILVQSPLNPSSPRLSLTNLLVHDSGDKNCPQSPRISLHMDISHRNIRRSFSESDLIRSEMKTFTKFGSRSFSAPRIPEEDEFVEDRKGDHWPAGWISWEETGFPGGGINKNGRTGGGGGGGNGGDAEDRCKIGAYYQEMLKSNPTNALLLRNYGKYLHEVEGDMVRAEEYYGRAILASPGDGEVLSLYGRLVWETSRDEGRAQSYFHQALHASPQDCMVLGSYARFLWETEEEDEEIETNEELAVVAKSF